MKILLAGILGGVAMFIWTSIAHMFLPLGEAGIREIPNESTVLSAMQSNIGEETGLYIFPGPGVGKNATREEKNEAMKHMGEKMAANPSGILMYHARSGPGRVPCGPDRNQQFLWPGWVRVRRRNTRLDRDQCFILELVRLSLRLHRQLHVHPGDWISVCRHCCSVDVAKARSNSVKF
jgi:hypothetical protein